MAFPLGRFTCVTGVSGSGKSTLVSFILYNALAARIHRARLIAGGHDSISGIEHVDKVINVDQAPIGNSPTSTPATYTGVFDCIRDLFATLPLSRIRGYTANRFSFNRPGGRCEACDGMGQRCIEMHFLPDVWVECEACKGARYVTDTLEVHYRGKSIADILTMRVSEALQLFENVPRVAKMLQTLDDVGLGYLQLGQPAPTLSAGEAQRVKLAAELGRPSTGKTLYILDEPTIGLHFEDVRKLLAVLHRLVDLGNTCICIEHNLDVIKTADWVIDLGPEAGEAGGFIVAEGTPEDLAGHEDSHTGVALRPVLEAGPLEERTPYDPNQDDPQAPACADPRRLKPAARKLTVTRVEQGVSPTAGEPNEDIAMPWEREGRAWHTVSHVDGNGVPVEWDPQLLLWLVDTIETCGRHDAPGAQAPATSRPPQACSFAPTDWKHRTRIEITAGSNYTCGGQHPWFCHILTRSKDLLEVALRVAEGTFAAANLGTILSIKTLDERRDLPIYGQWDRARLRMVNPGWEEVRLHLRDFKDVKKATFRTFLKTAVRGYFKQLETAAADPDHAGLRPAASPWRTDGRQWHLSQRSINKRHVISWKPQVLLSMIGRFKSIEPDLAVSWSSRTAVKLQVQGDQPYAAKIVTNIGRGLRIELRTPTGSSTPTQIDRLGLDTDIKHRGDCDWIVFWIRSLSQNDSKQLRETWQRACSRRNDRSTGMNRGRHFNERVQSV